MIISRRCCRNCCRSDRMYIIETHTTRYLIGYVPQAVNLDRQVSCIKCITITTLLVRVVRSEGRRRA